MTGRSEAAVAGWPPEPVIKAHAPRVKARRAVAQSWRESGCRATEPGTVDRVPAWLVAASAARSPSVRFSSPISANGERSRDAHTHRQSIARESTLSSEAPGASGANARRGLRRAHAVDEPQDAGDGRRDRQLAAAELPVDLREAPPDPSRVAFGAPRAQALGRRRTHRRRRGTQTGARHRPDDGRAPPRKQEPQAPGPSGSTHGPTRSKSSASSSAGCSRRRRRRLRQS